MRAWLSLGGWTLAMLLLSLFVLLLRRLRSRLSRAEESERLAVERRDRFFTVAASELDAPLSSLRNDVAALDAWSATPARLGQIARELDRLREALSELARVPAPLLPSERVDVDVAELVRDVVAQPPFSDRGPSVILRASRSLVLGDRARLSTGVRVLLWVARRNVSDGSALVVTVSSDSDGTYLEIDSGGGGEAADALELLPAVMHGDATPQSQPGTTLALQVATRVARAHGGRLSASARVGRGERFVLELPRAG